MTFAEPLAFTTLIWTGQPLFSLTGYQIFVQGRRVSNNLRFSSVHFHNQRQRFCFVRTYKKGLPVFCIKANEHGHFPPRAGMVS